MLCGCLDTCLKKKKNTQTWDENPKAEKVCGKYPFDRVVSFVLSAFGTVVVETSLLQACLHLEAVLWTGILLGQCKIKLTG